MTEPDQLQPAAAESIGVRLRRLRVERKLSQRELAGPGVSYAYISRIEAGARRPSVKALRTLARKLGVSAEYLETGSEIHEFEERELRLADAELKLRLDESAAAADELEQILTDALAVGDSSSALRARVNLGLAAFRGGNDDKAVGYLEDAIASELMSPSGRPDVYATLGRAYAKLGQPQKSAQFFEDCLAQVVEQVPDDAPTQVRFATYLSYALTELGDLEGARDVVHDALRRSGEFPDPYTRVRLYWSLGRIAEEQQRSIVALGYFRRAVALLEATEDTLHLARAHLSCSLVMITSGQAREAGDHLELAERLLGPRPEQVDLVMLRTQQAARASALGNPAEALERGREAIEHSGDTLPAERGKAWQAIAEANALLGDTNAASEAFEKAIALLDGHGTGKERIEAYRAWGRVLREAGRENEALDVLERAADVASERRPTKTR